MRLLLMAILITTSLVAFGKKIKDDLGPEPILVTFACKPDVRDICSAFRFGSKVPGCMD